MRTVIRPQTQLVFLILVWYKKWAVLCKCFVSFKVFQVDAKFIPAANSQAVDLIQSEPKLASKFSKTSFVVIPTAEEIYRAVPSLLKHRPTATSCFLITENFKFFQTIRINFIHSTDIVTGLVSFSAIIKNWNYWTTNIKYWTMFGIFCLNLNSIISGKCVATPSFLLGVQQPLLRSAFTRNYKSCKIALY